MITGAPIPTRIRFGASGQSNPTTPDVSAALQLGSASERRLRTPPMVPVQPPLRSPLRRQKSCSNLAPSCKPAVPPKPTLLRLWRSGSLGADHKYAAEKVMGLDVAGGSTGGGVGCTSISDAGAHPMCVRCSSRDLRNSLDSNASRLAPSLRLHIMSYLEPPIGRA